MMVTWSNGHLLNHSETAAGYKREVLFSTYLLNPTFSKTTREGQAQWYCGVEEEASLQMARTGKGKIDRCSTATVIG
jgi:hypothetical protein